MRDPEFEPPTTLAERAALERSLLKALPSGWRYSEGCAIQAGLLIRGDYVASVRWSPVYGDKYVEDGTWTVKPVIVLNYRPAGRHEHVGTFGSPQSLGEAHRLHVAVREGRV